MAPAGTSSAVDMDLAQQARAGDNSALAALYQRHQRPLLAHAYRMLGSRAAAEDAVQEAFARGMAALPRTRGELRFRPWIYRITTNLCLKQLNRGRRTAPHGQALLERHPAADATANPEHQRRRQEIGDLVARALQDLPPKYRQILLLREIDGLSYDELAQVLDIDANRVKVNLHRARSRFAALFVTARLMESPEAEINCTDLRELVQQGERSKVQAHLQRCDHCRQREHRPAAELFALLPPLPPPTATAPGASEPQPPPAATQTAPPLPGAAAASGGGLGLGAKLVLALGGAVVLGAVIVSTRINQPHAVSRAPQHRQREQPPGREAATAQREQSQRLPPARSSSARSTPGAGAVRTHAGARAVRRGTRGAGHTVRQPRLPVAAGNAGTGPTVAASPPGDRTRATPRPAAPPGPARGAALRVKLRLSPGGAWLMRANEPRRALTPKTVLLTGDRLLSRGSSRLGLLLPGDRWIVLQGAMTLTRLPRKGLPCTPCPVQVTLHWGALRARASRSGPVTVAVGQSTVQASAGELRIRSQGADVEIEALDNYVEVNGPHARRTISPGTHLSLQGARPGFAQQLLAAPQQLRPVRGRVGPRPQLRWAPVPTAERYRVELGTGARFMTRVRVIEVERPPVRPHLPPGKYFWQVVALRGQQLGRPSKIYSFTVE